MRLHMKYKLTLFHKEYNQFQKEENYFYQAYIQ